MRSGILWGTGLSILFYFCGSLGHSTLMGLSLVGEGEPAPKSQHLQIKGKAQIPLAGPKFLGLLGAQDRPGPGGCRRWQSTGPGLDPWDMVSGGKQGTSACL